MSDYDLLFEKVRAIAEEMCKLQTVAVAQYTPVVDAIIASRCHDTRHIEHTLDRLLDIAGHPAGLELFRSLCRYYYPISPAATADYIQAYRELWDVEEIRRQSGATNPGTSDRKKRPGGGKIGDKVGESVGKDS